MKKVFALSVATILMMGTASQAMAAFELGNLTMVVWENGTAKKEIAFDLGNIDTLLATTGTQNLGPVSIGNQGWSFATATSGVGVFADTTDYSNYSYSGYFAITSNDPTLVKLGSNTGAWETAVNEISNRFGSDADGVRGTADAGGYYKTMLLSANTSAGKYAGMRTVSGLEAEYPVAAGSVATMYLWGFDTNSEGNVYLINNEKSTATITLNSDGLVTFTATPAAVPVPGAAALLGSALLGLAGVRRRQNS